MILKNSDTIETKFTCRIRLKKLFSQNVIKYRTRRWLCKKHYSIELFGNNHIRILLEKLHFKIKKEQIERYLK